MAEMTNDILMLAAVVTSYVGILKAYGVPGKHNHQFSLVAPRYLYWYRIGCSSMLLTISLVGLTASGAYHYSKGQAKSGGPDDATRNSGNSRGIDVFKWQGQIDCSAVKGDGIAFVIMKATEGVSAIIVVAKDKGIPI